VSKNKGVVDSVALTSSCHVSVLSTLSAKELLGSSALPDVIQSNRKNLRNAYVVTTSRLNRAGIEYFPCNATVAVFCRLAPHATSVQEEMAAFHQYLEAGVMVTPGVAYHVTSSQNGWMRVSFAVSEVAREKGMSRIEAVYRRLEQKR
jgi:aspartate/methionine/tyrosine aminotransferase